MPSDADRWPPTAPVSAGDGDVDLIATSYLLSIDKCQNSQEATANYLNSQIQYYPIVVKGLVKNKSKSKGSIVECYCSYCV